MTAKDYLLQLMVLRKRIAQQCSLVDDCIDEACRATSRMRAVNISGTGYHSRVETYVDRLIDVEREKIDPMRRQLWQLEQEVLRITGAMPAGRWRQVLELRYLRGMAWEQVAEEIDRSLRATYSIHGHALIIFAQTYNRMRLDSTPLT